jgi:hypothetical protein
MDKNKHHSDGHKSEFYVYLFVEGFESILINRN